ncbi:MAG: HAD-IIIC family phosphatase [Acetatifactor sp.]|nr:HAD-IIIC family phosphatase [Acetatifactor sp.]
MEHILEYPFDAEQIIKKKKSIRKYLLEREGCSYIDKNIAVLGGSTTNVLVNILELFLLRYGIKPHFYESEYNMYYEDGMFPNPRLEAFRPDLIYIHTSYRNIVEYPVISDREEDVDRKCRLTYEKFEGLWEHIADTYHCPIIQNNFELPFYRVMGSREASDFRGSIHFVNELNRLFYKYVSSHENIFIHDIAFEQAEYGIRKWSDPYYWHMYKYACCVPAIPDSAFNVANIVKSIFGRNKKVLNLDLDNTLWGGIIGDDGADNIEIGQETSLGQTFAEFQTYVRQLKDIGVLLTVNSKNEEANALLGFQRPDSILRREDFITFKANWNPKSQNLAETAQELNLGTDSFVFADDNPAEREIIRQNFQGLEIVNLDTPEHYIISIDRAGYFEMTSFSADDMRRSEMYRSNIARNQALTNFKDYGEYLRSLEMKGEIKPFSATYMSRISQLTNKSNQFNLTTRRYTQAQIEEAAADPMKITLYGKLADKFGDNGVVSVVIGSRKENALHIDLWLMSCRVLKRDMEYAMMDELVSKCMAAGIRRIVGYYYPTRKNGMVCDFYENQGFSQISADDMGNTVWEYLITDQYKNRNEVINVNERSAT